MIFLSLQNTAQFGQESPAQFKKNMQSYNPPVGLHTVLSDEELNWYTHGINDGLHAHSLGHPGSPLEFCGIVITPKESNANGSWDVRSHYQKHWFGYPMQQISATYQVELEDWNI